jgi:hypothetical protein
MEFTSLILLLLILLLIIEEKRRGDDCALPKLSRNQEDACREFRTKCFRSTMRPRIACAVNKTSRTK